MPKRFFDTKLHRKAWFRALPLEEREAFRYLLAECDQVGVWEPEFDIAEIVIGCSINWEHLVLNCNGNIEIMANGKLFLPEFFNFQYGEVDPGSRSPAMKSHINRLKEHGLYGRVSGRAYGRAKEEEEVKVKVKEEDKEPSESIVDNLGITVAPEVEEFMASFRRKMEEA